MTVERHDYAERGAAALCAGRVRLVHRRTRRTYHNVYGAVHLGGLEVVGGCRPAAGSMHDDAAVDGLLRAWQGGERLTAVLRRILDEVGPEEFGLAAALPGAEGRILDRTAHALADRFTHEFDRLLDDHRRSLAALAEAGYPLPDELRAPVELALARRLRDDLLSLAEGADGLALQGVAQAIAEADEIGAQLALPSLAPVARLALERLVAEAVADPSGWAAADAQRLLELLRALGLGVALDAAQELVYAALVEGDGTTTLEALGRALGLAVGRLGIPR